jgi:hypothetical protein
MSFGEEQQMRGTLTIEVLDTAGNVVARRCVENLITTAGKTLLAKLLMGKASTVPSKWAIAVGTGNADPLPGDDKLSSRVDVAAATTEVGVVATDRGNVVRATVKAQLPSLPQGADPQPLVEAGIVITVGTDPETLFNRVKFAQVSRGSSVVMNLGWEISF